jgi:hypothetical protein
MTKSPKRLVLGLLAVTGLGVLGLQWALTPPPGVTVRSFGQIRCGMTLEQVESALGRPADEQGTYGRRDGGMRWYRWRDGPLQIEVVIDQDGSVWDGWRLTRNPGARLLPGRDIDRVRAPRPLLDTLRGVLHL